MNPVLRLGVMRYMSIVECNKENQQGIPPQMEYTIYSKTISFIVSYICKNKNLYLVNYVLK